MEERRRFARRPVDNGSISLPSTLNVQVLDISVTGVLLRSTRPVELGARGSLRLNFGGTPLTADIRVQRISESPNNPAEYSIGAMFLGITPQHRQLIERFMVQ
jgi:hypothetical protein